ncbi:MAG: MFS transporter [Chloroflexota bacterium]
MNKFFSVIWIKNNFSFFQRIIELFGLIFIYQLFEHDLLLTFGFFGFFNVLHGVSVIPFSMFIGKVGTQRAIGIAAIVFAFSTSFIFLYQHTEDTTYIFCWFLCFIIAKLLFYTALTYYITTYTEHENRGSQISYDHMIQMIVIITAPILGGYLSEFYGIGGVMLVGSVILLLLFIPLSQLPNRQYKLNYIFLEEIKENKRLVYFTFLTEYSNEVEKIWALFLFILLGSSYTLVGNFLGISTAVSFVCIYFLGKLLDSYNRVTSLKLLMVLVAVLRVIRLSFESIFPLSIVESITKVFENLRFQTVQTITYDLVEENLERKSVHENIITKEMWVNIGRGMGLFSSAVIAHFFGFKMAITVMALSALWIFFFKPSTSKMSLSLGA